MRFVGTGQADGEAAPTRRCRFHVEVQARIDLEGDRTLIRDPSAMMFKPVMFAFAASLAEQEPHPPGDSYPEVGDLDMLFGDPPVRGGAVGAVVRPCSTTLLARGWWVGVQEFSRAMLAATASYSRLPVVAFFYPTLQRTFPDALSTPSRSTSRFFDQPWWRPSLMFGIEAEAATVADPSRHPPFGRAVLLGRRDHARGAAGVSRRRCRLPGWSSATHQALGVFQGIHLGDGSGYRSVAPPPRSGW